jgi:membrane-associated phospholipid phosphatase
VNILILGIYKGGTYDSLLISSDRQLFGGDPTLWLAHSASPGVTEVLQIAYSLFYLFFVVVGFELYTRDSSLFGRFRFAVTLGFFLSYAGYLMVPAVGPRFTLHEYSRIGSELPGLFFTPCLRRFVDFGDSIPAGASSALAYSLAQRDAFPSGHTMMTVIVAVLAFQWRARSRFFVLPAGVLLIAATVYLRYHYIVDILAGGLLAIVCLRTSPWLYRRFERYLRNASQI